MIVLDTHILIWWVDSPQKLSKKAREIIEKEKLKKGNISVSSISALEIYRLVKNGRLQLTTPIESWMGKIESLPSIQFIPVDNSIASLSVALPNFDHEDPADRIIIATALNIGAKLITSDKRILKYKKVKTIW